MCERGGKEMRCVCVWGEGGRKEEMRSGGGGGGYIALASSPDSPLKKSKNRGEPGIFFRT